MFFGPKKVVVLAGCRTVKEALVDYDEEFGERDPLLRMDELNKGHGKTTPGLLFRHCFRLLIN